MQDRTELTYGIRMVLDMLDSPDLQGTTPEEKRRALLVALQESGTQIDDPIRDAIVRQRALDDYDQRQQEKLLRFEGEKDAENAALREELARITARYTSRIQANHDAVEAHRDALANWQRWKQRESRRIAGAAACLMVPHQEEQDYSAFCPAAS
jgi:hypothetical protein